jgi:LCP family protein required for cell wall assembly
VKSSDGSGVTRRRAGRRVPLGEVTDGLPPFQDGSGAPANYGSLGSRGRMSARRRKGAHFAPKAAKAQQRRRWPRRLMIGFGVLVILAAGLVVSGVVYARIKYDEIKKVKIAGEQPAKPGAPFNILLVGSDSRQFVDSGSQANEFGSGSAVSGQRSDVIIIARVVPATHQVLMLSIPRDTWVNIPGNVPDISGMNRVNAAFNNGPALLVQTIEQDFNIPINHYVEVNFEGFSNIVNALGGIYLDFSTPVYDKMSGLKITTTGCQLVQGPQALSLVRSRDEYYESDGSYDYDGMGDWSRIRRQDAFFRAVIARLDSQDTNPLALDHVIDAVVGDVTIDDALSEGDLFDLAKEFHGLGEKALTTEVLPTTPQVLNGNDVLDEAQPYDEEMIAKFLAFGTGTGSSSHGASSGTTTTNLPAIAPSQVSVQVLNGNGQAGAAGTAAGQLQSLGFVVSSTGDASSFSYGSNEVQYGPAGHAAAELLQSRLVGGATLVEEPSLTGSGLVLLVGSSYAGVVASASSAGAPTTTAPATAPSDVVFDNQQTLPEPWDPTPCNP